MRVHRLLMMHRTMMTVMDRTMLMMHRMMYLRPSETAHKDENRPDQQ
jgi:hypothetical protein